MATKTEERNKKTTGGSTSSRGREEVTTEDQVDAALARLVADEIEDRKALEQVRNEQQELLEAMEQLGMELPAPHDDDEPAPASRKPTSNNGTPGKRRGGPTKMEDGRNLYEVVRDWMWQNRYVEPRYAEVSEIQTMAVKLGFSTAVNMLVSKVREGKFVKGGLRGRYALPKNYRPGQD